jgi:hypothetical protein
MKKFQGEACGHEHRRKSCPEAHLTACNLSMWITSACNTEFHSTLPDFEMCRSLSVHELSPNIEKCGEECPQCNSNVATDP